MGDNKRYAVNSFAQFFDSEEKPAGCVLSTERLSVEAYRLKEGDSVVMSYEDEDVEYGAEVHFAIIAGEVEIKLPDERVSVKAGELYSHFETVAFSVKALDDSNILCCHNMIVKSVRDDFRPLINYVKELEKKDLYLAGHNARVGEYTGLILRYIEPSVDWADAQAAASCHDVGKVRISEEILNKPGKLTDEEFAEIKKHPIYSYEMISEIRGEEFAKCARWHHEKLNGKGYPDGLSGEQIPLESRAMAVADIFDALTTSRSYRKAFSFEKALDILDEEAEAGAIDKGCLEALKKLVDNGVICEGVDNEWRNHGVFD